MKQVGKLRALAGRRAGIVVGIFAALALSVGAGAVLAGASPSGITLKFHGAVARAPVALHPNALGKRVIVGHAVRHDRSLPLRSLPRAPRMPGYEVEPSPNPRGAPRHVDRVD